MTTSGFVRAVDGDTLDVRIAGRRVTVGLIGVTAPMGNTDCGRQATAFVQSLVMRGLTLQEDPQIAFDSRTRRMYDVLTPDGASVSEALAAAGFAWANGLGRRAATLATLQREAAIASRGCVYRAPRPPSLPQEGAEVPLPPSNLWDQVSRLLEPELAALRSLGSLVAPVAHPALAAAAAPGASSAPLASALPTGFVEDTVASALTLPTAFAFLPDGRLLIAEKSGRVRLVKDGVLQPTPFIDIRAFVNDYYDRGLLGIAVDPNFATNGYVYLLYTYENDPTQYNGTKTARLSRFTATGDTAGNEQVILGTQVGASCNLLPPGADCLPSDWYGHTIGNIKFAPDGTMFVTTGDGASWNTTNTNALRAQDLDSLAGKILRINPDGTGVASNPFWNGNPSANRSKVWGYGLRNPYRFDVRPGTSVPYIGDVGWNDWEEINLGIAGSNFGWPCYEGNLRQAGYEPMALCQALYSGGPTRGPLITYNHNGTTSAVTAGQFDAGGHFPAPYQGAYFFGDYAQSFIKYVPIDASHNVTGSPAVFATGTDGPVDIQIGPDGNLYYLAISAQQLRRVRFTGGPPPPPSSGYLSDRSWTSMINGWGPAERDMSNGEEPLGDGRPITLNGTTYTKGLGVHAPSDIRYALAGACTSFQSAVGVDDEVGPNGSVIFRVYTDGILRYDSGLMTGTTATRQVDVSLTGVNELRLVVADGGNGIAADHADWADARVTCSAQGDVTPPEVLSTSPADGATGVAFSANASAVFTEAIDPSTVTGATFTLTRQGAGQPTAATVAYDAGTRTATLDPLADLEAGATYTARIVGGASGVKDLAGNALATDKTWSFTTALLAGTSGFLSDWVWTFATNGWGPVEKDQSNGESGAGDGGPLTLNATTFAKGLGVHAPSEIRYATGGSCSTLTGYVGVDDEVGLTGSVIFQVLGDGVVLFDSGVMAGGTPTRAFTVDIAGRTTIALVVTDAGDGPTGDHADWADLYIACSGSGNSRPTPSISLPTPSTRYRVGDIITFSGSATDLQDGPIPASQLAWNVIIHHCPAGACHTHFIQSTTGASGGFTVPDHGDESYLEFVLSATDSAGATGTTSVSLLPQTIQLTLATVPPGLQLVYSGAPVRTPFMTRTTVGSTHTIFAPSPQGTRTFVSWSDGGAQQHDITIGATDITYTATFSGGESSITYLSDLGWSLATNGWGPVERDRSNGETAPGDGRPITLNGTTFPKGLGVHAYSDVRFLLGGSCSTFLATIGVDDEVGPNGSVIFRVFTDGVLRYDSGLMTGSTASKDLSLPITGANELRLEVTDAGDGNAADHADWANAQVDCGSGTPTPAPSATASPAPGTTVPPTSSSTLTVSPTPSPTPAPGITYLSDLGWSLATNGWGPVERDRSNGETAPGDGRPITLNGTTFPKGLGVHAYSDVRFLLGGSCSTFLATIGVDDEVGPNGSVIFRVFTDGVLRYDSGLMTGSTASKDLSLPITGANELRLEVTDAGDGNVADHADWANARVDCGSLGGTPSPPPTGTTPPPSTPTPTAATATPSTPTPTPATATPSTPTPTPPQTPHTPTATSAPSPSTPTPSLTPTGPTNTPSPPPTTATPTGTATRYLSDLQWSLAINSWGPVERDRSNGETAPGDGRPITLNGTTFPKGLGVHAYSDVRFLLGGSCSTFLATIGVDDEVGPNGSVIFRVFTDGVLRYDSGPMTGSTASKDLSLPITGANELRLEVTDAGDGNVADHADWANARVTCS